MTLQVEEVGESKKVVLNVWCGVWLCVFPRHPMNVEAVCVVVLCSLCRSDCWSESCACVCEGSEVGGRGEWLMECSPRQYVGRSLEIDLVGYMGMVRNGSCFVEGL